MGETETGKVGDNADARGDIKERQIWSCGNDDFRLRKSKKKKKNKRAGR